MEYGKRSQVTRYTKVDQTAVTLYMLYRRAGRHNNHDWSAGQLFLVML